MSQSSVTIIKLSGPLIREFGREHRRLLDTGTVQEAFSALRNTLPGFKEAIQRLERMGMRFAIFRNRKNIGEGDMGSGGSREVRIVPVISGSKRAGLLQTVVGAALIVASFFWRPDLASRRCPYAGWRCPDDQPAGQGPEPVSRPGEPAQLRLRQCEEHHRQR